MSSERNNYCRKAHQRSSAYSFAVNILRTFSAANHLQTLEKYTAEHYFFWKVNYPRTSHVYPAYILQTTKNVHHTYVGSTQDVHSKCSRQVIFCCKGVHHSKNAIPQHLHNNINFCGHRAENLKNIFLP